MAVQILKSKMESVGVGKQKADYLEVMYGWDEIKGDDVDTQLSGSFSSMEMSTGSSLDEPFGLLLVGQSLCVNHYVLGGGSRGGALSFVSEANEVVGQSIMDLETYGVDHVIVAGTASGDLAINTGYPNMPLLVSEEYSGESMQRVFVGGHVNLEMQHFLLSTSVSDRFRVTAKVVFKKVKMTKSAYMEKLAIRAYS